MKYHINMSAVELQLTQKLMRSQCPVESSIELNMNVFLEYPVFQDQS